MKTNKETSKLRGWLMMGLTILLLWCFAAIVGPWGEANIPVFHQIVETIEARDIDAGAYFYTEIEASYSGERELLGSIRLKRPDQAGFTLPLVSGIITCFVILFFGFRYLPNIPPARRTQRLDRP